MIGQTPPRPRPNHHLKPGYEPDTGPSSHQLHSQSPVFRRSEPHLPQLAFGEGLPSLNKQITSLEAKKRKCMMKRQYSRAERIDKRLRWARAAAAQAETKELLQGQREERRSLSEAHQRQMAYLHREWKQYFLQLHQRETLIFRSFQKEQIHTHMAAETALRRRCASLHTTAPDIRYLQQQEQLLRKSQDFHHLKAVKQQLAEAEQRERHRRSQAVAKFVELQQDRLRVTYCKKYEVLVTRLEEYRRDKERVYLREQRRLRQKYKNVMQQLRHEQALEMQQHSLFIQCG